MSRTEVGQALDEVRLRDNEKSHGKTHHLMKALFSLKGGDVN